MSRSDDFGGGAMDQVDPTWVQQRCGSVVRFRDGSLPKNGKDYIHHHTVYVSGFIASVS